MSDPLLHVILVSIGGYLLGAVPFGVLVSRAMGVDITSVGSGNIGATNVYRALGWKAALTVFLLDVLKGVVPALAARAIGLSEDAALLAGLAAVFGHCLSPFLRFKGGKGIATSLGAALGSVPVVALLALGVFLLFMGLTRFVSLSSILGVSSTLLWGALLGATTLQMALFAAVSAFIVIRHIPNIRRLMKGEEPRFPKGSRGPDPDPAEQEGTDPEHAEHEGPDPHETSYEPRGAASR